MTVHVWVAEEVRSRPTRSPRLPDAIPALPNSGAAGMHRWET